MTVPFTQFATTTLERWLARHPDEATFLGDHAHDGALGDPSAEAAQRRREELRNQLTGLDAASTASRDEQIDAEVLRTTLRAELFALEELDEAAWNPMEHNPGNALYALASRPFAPAGQRWQDARSRLLAVPAHLDAARARLTTMSRVHVETALAQLEGTVALIDDELPRLAEEAGASIGDDGAEARAALVVHQDWLRARLDDSTRSPRIGAELFRAKLALTLDTDFAPDALLARAESDLERITAEITEVAGRVACVSAPDASTVRQVLDELARDSATDATILDLCRGALAQTTAFVRDRDLVTVFDDPVEIIEMPEIDRGIAGAYCNPAGPLEQAELATQFAVSPTPEGWDEQQITSYYREYNVHMLHDLTVHEAMPGHALQLMHSNRHRASTPVRAVFGSGSFIEGWAVYAEELMADHGYRSAESERAAAAHRLQQLKMQLRTTLNTILDIRFHCQDLDEAGTVELLTAWGYQEAGEAAEKWRRVQLTSTQLCTYYVGYCEVRDLIRDVHDAQPTWTERAVHDAVLAHGSPPVRHLRTLLLT